MPKEKDVRDLYISQIIRSQPKMIVLRTPPIVFLCGGDSDVKNPSPVSLRGALVNYIHEKDLPLADHITLAESYKNWERGAVYNDLMVFEEDLALFASMIALILESPGAIAELGAFASNNTLKNKLLIVVSEKHYNEDSYIKLGPINHIEQIDQTLVFVVDWNVGDMNSLDAEELEALAESMGTLLENHTKDEVFNSQNNAHIAFLVFQIIKSFVALKSSEIEGYIFDLIGSDQSNFSQKQNLSVTLKRSLFMLETFEFIEKQKSGHYTYYMATEKQGDRIKFLGRPNFSSEAYISCVNYYRDSDSRRFKLIKKKREKS